uniref:BZIP domain-containing protein n=1 Tax=Parastrongyloides trichosuri TaxID=131310 RepID=A0A0N4ZWW5_PARTI
MESSHDIENSFLDTSVLDEFLTPNMLDNINNGNDLENDPEFDKILNMLTNDDVKDPLEQSNCNDLNCYYSPNLINTPSSTSSDSGRYSPPPFDLQEYSSSSQHGYQIQSPEYYNQYSNHSSSDISNVDYTSSSVMTSRSSTSPELNNWHQPMSINNSSITLNNEQKFQTISNNNISSPSSVVLLNPVKIVQPGTIKLQPVQIIPQQQSQVCFVLDNNIPNQPLIINNPKPSTTSNKIPLPVNKTLQKMEISKSNNVSLNSIDESEKEYIRKREERKAKNRMAAHVSRQRKKNEFNELQSKLKIIEDENIILKEENVRLKNRIYYLEKEIESLRCSPDYKPVHKKAKIGAFTAICMIGLLFTFQGSDYLQNSSQTNIQQEPTNVRALTVQQSALQTKENSINDNYLIKKMSRSLLIKNTTKDLHLIKNTVNIGNETKYSNCSHFLFNDYKSLYLNESAKNKINNELTFWFDEHEKIYKNDDSSLLEGIRNFRKNLHNSANGRRTNKKQVKKLIVEEKANYPLSLPKIIRKNILTTIVDAMKRKNNTIYVMPQKNYYLLPAINRDNSTIPKMALFIPSERISNGGSKTEINMLKIECEIVGTEFFNLPISLFNFDGSTDDIPGFI